MKLSQYAKNLGICYRTAWNMFKNDQIPGSFQLPTGTIIVPDDLPEQKTEIIEEKKDSLMEDFISIITLFCTRLYGTKKSKQKTEKIIQKLND